MDNFKAVYKFLKALEASMDLDAANVDMFNAEKLGVSQNRWNRYIEMMYDVGYIKGIQITKYVDGTTMVDCDDIEITLKGLEYLQENSIMQKIYKAAKGVKDITPGI